MTQGAMWPDRVVVSTPLLDDTAGFLQCVEDLAIEQFVPIADLSRATAEPSLVGKFC